MDEAIAQVVAFCDTTPERAAQYIQLADGDANQAVQLFFDNNGADLAGQFSAAPNPPTTSSRVTGAGNAQDPINIDDDDVPGVRVPEESAQSAQQTAGAAYEDDEAMARRLQEEMYGGGGGPGGAEEAEVRAPIARQTETLLGPGAESAPYAGTSLDAAIQQRMQAMQNRRGSGPGRSAGIFNQHQPTSDIWRGQRNDAAALSEATGGASDGSSRNGMLARLYQPPWELMHKGSWEDARDEGKEDKKWLLVNIQDASIFDCQVLNRDLWKNDGVTETTKENFIFLQYSKDDPRAEQYVQYYFHDHENPEAYPHVAIVDPRTGEQIKLWSRKIPKAADFLMQIHEFLDRYSLEAGARNPVAKRKPEPKKAFEQMTEEEQLEQALQASLASQENHLKPPNDDPDDLTRSIGDLRNPAAMEDVQTGGPSNDTSVEASIFSTIPSDQPHTEPAPGPDVTRIQIRHPSGRIVRRFKVSDPVQTLFEYLKAEPLEGREGQEFELVSLGKNLMGSRSQTIEEAGLKNASVMVEFIEE